MWYRRTFEIDKKAMKNQRAILHFEGSDFTTKVWVNGECLGQHKGGYTRFSFDMTSVLADGENIVTVRVEDSLDPRQPRGKQRWRQRISDVGMSKQPVSGNLYGWKWCRKADWNM